MWKYLILLSLVLAVVACTNREGRRITFDGIAFRTTAQAVDRRVTLEAFVVEVRDAAAALDAARAAANYEGIKYCIAQYGTSRIDWVVDPSDTSSDTEARLTMTDGDLRVQGRCDP